jgi:hypothetical protein
MSRGHIEFVRLDGLPMRAWMPQGRFAGLRAASLSRDADTGAETLIVEACAFWRWADAVAWPHDVEIYVLSGLLIVDGRELRAGGHAYWPVGTTCRGCSSPEGARFLWMAGDDAAPAADGTRGLTLTDTTAMPWAPSPAFEGRSSEDAGPGLGVRFLREDAGTGAYTLMTRHAPGWSDPRLESHDTWEELVLVEGDYLMGETGAVDAGTYIFRPGSRPHGPQATRGGAVWFCRGERRIDFRFTATQWADGQVARYLRQDRAPAPS